MRRSYYIIAAILVIIGGAYTYFRFFLLKTKDQHPAPQAKNILDLRPAMINKLEDMVKHGSDGLYNLTIQKLEPDVSDATVDLYGIGLSPDSAAISRLDSLKQLPDDIFRITLPHLHVTGLGIKDFLNKKNIDLGDIAFTEPKIYVYHRSRPYNAQRREKENAKTLYQKLTEQFKSIVIRSVTADKGTLVSTDLSHGGRKKTFNNLTLSIRDFRVDSTTQFDRDRVLFSKEVELSSDHYESRTADSMYFFRIASIKVSATKHTMEATGTELVPRYGRDEFEKKSRTVKDYFNMRFPKLVFNNVDWWLLMADESFASDDAEMSDAFISDYFDRTKPRDTINYRNFPGQLLKQVPIKLNVKKLRIRNSMVEYEELSPESLEKGKISFTGINGQINNVTNIPAAIAANHQANVSLSAHFMKTVPVTTHFMFDLFQKDGVFATDITIGKMDSAVINPVLRPMGLVEIKEGTIDGGSARVTGNNYNAKADVCMLFSKLHLTPLKRDPRGEGLKKKTVLSFIANTFILKKNNPEDGNPPHHSVVPQPRAKLANFFSFGWAAVHKGILRSLGVPFKKG